MTHENILSGIISSSSERRNPAKLPASCRVYLCPPRFATTAVSRYRPKFGLLILPRHHNPLRPRLAPLQRHDLLAMRVLGDLGQSGEIANIDLTVG